MLFNSFAFAAFFLIVYSLYLLFQKNLNWQNRMLVVAGCVFYGWWDWRFLSLLFFTAGVDYFIGNAIHASQDLQKRRSLLVVSMTSNLTVLGFFKYFNFFIASFERLLQLFHVSIHSQSLHIVLPVGVSFYTFASMSYTIDIYRKQLIPAKNFFDFSAFVTFFPQLLAGPIARAGQLLPQIIQPRKIKLDQFYEGCYLIFWGLFKKTFVADNLALVVNPVFSSAGHYNGAQVLFSTYAFAFQIYCDFSGYTDIARGLAKLMGVELMLNFNLPYFATNPSDFWKRWHISLSTWLRDYLYIPLGGNQKSDLLTYRNLMITMLMSGLWHGAAWHFVIWGMYHGLLLCIYKLIKPWLDTFPKIKSPFLKNLWFVIKILFFFQLTCLGWLFFRAESFTQIVEMLRALFTNFSIGRGMGLGYNLINPFVFFSFALLFIQYFQYRKNDLMIVLKSPFILRVLLYVILFFLIVFYGAEGEREFIYFQF